MRPKAGVTDIEPPTEVKRPWLVGVLASAAAVSAVAAIAGLGRVSQIIAERPTTLASEADLLEAALQEAPWVELGEAEGPVVWAVAAPQCADCQAFFEEDIAALRAEGLRVRLILVSSPAERNNFSWTDMAYAGELPPPDFIRETRPAAANQARLEWGRAAHDRLSAIVAMSGERMSLPSLFWRSGPQWRAAFGGDGRGVDHIRSELAPN